MKKVFLMAKNVKIVVYVPVTHTDIVLKALGEAGAGAIGNYSHCSFTTRGTGRFMPGAGTNPFIGQQGILEAVEEDRIETIIPRDRLKRVIEAMEAVHPYEEIAFDIYPLEDRP